MSCRSRERSRLSESGSRAAPFVGCSGVFTRQWVTPALSHFRGVDSHDFGYVAGHSLGQ